MKKRAFFGKLFFLIHEWEMDRLQEIAVFYRDNLENKKFKLTAGKKGKTITLIISFLSGHFFHLAGLHKLNDIAQLKAKKDIVYKNILDGKISHEIVEKSTKYKDIESRIKYFETIKEALFAKEIMIKSLQGYFFNIKADYMLTYKNSGGGYAHLFLKGDSDAVPVTYILHPKDTYLQNNSNKWTVLSVEEIVDKNI